jgi:hypothetical protein
MAVHRIAKRAGTLLASAGASPNTAGIVCDTTDGGVSTRNAFADAVKVTADGTIFKQLADCLFHTKTIVDGSATSLFELAVASGAMSGGWAFYMVEASDGTDYQTMAGMITFSAVNKAGTVTSTAPGYATGNDCKSVSSGTLTLAWTATAGTLKTTIKLQPTGSLTETTPYRVSLMIFPFRGAITLL